MSLDYFDALSALNSSRKMLKVLISDYLDYLHFDKKFNF